MNSKIQYISFKVIGKVQGVCFRAYTQEKALLCNIDGWVKNQPDGSVSGEANGVEENIHTFIHFLKTGSPNSSIQNLEIVSNESSNQYEGFQILY